MTVAFLLPGAPPSRALGGRRRLRAAPLLCGRGGPGQGEEEETPLLPPGGDAAAAADARQDGSGGASRANFGFVGSQKIGLAFTCTVCETRSVKRISRKAYSEGVVLVKCPGCKKRHIIADHLNWYSSITGGLHNVEEIASATGQTFQRASPEAFKLERILFDIEDPFSSS